MALHITSINSMEIKNYFYFIASIDIYRFYRFILLFTPVILVQHRNGENTNKQKEENSSHSKPPAQTPVSLTYSFRTFASSSCDIQRGGPADLIGLRVCWTNALTTR